MKFSNMLASSLQSDLLARCRQVLSHYIRDSSTATIVPLAATGGFSGAGIFCIHVAGQDYCLRRWPTLAPDPARLIGLHRLLDHTASLGLTQIAVPLKSAENSTLVGADTHWWQLEPWLPGQADFHRQPTRTRLKEALQVLARWHLAAQRFVPRAAEQTWFSSCASAPSPGLAERSRRIKQWRGISEQAVPQLLQAPAGRDFQPLLAQIGRHCQALAPTISRKLAGLLPTPVPLQPCLRDIWHDHLLFTGDQLTGLIDPSACRTENVATDLARLLGSLVEDDRAEWDFALDCYQAVRPLSLTELRLLPAFDDSGVLLSGITWLEWLLVEQRPFQNAELVQTRLEMVQRRLTRLRDRSEG